VTQVVLTDYPDQALVGNMAYNVGQNGVEAQVTVRGYIWGRPVQPLLEPLSRTMTGAKFDLILLSDLIFNHSEVKVLPYSALPSDSEVRWLASRIALDV
jgi:nicotinamide N-methyltransferase